MDNQYNIGIDIGGTKVNIGLVSLECGVIEKRKISTPSTKDAKQFVKIIVDEIHQLLSENNVQLDQINFIGAGVPGTVNMKEGIVEYCPNLGWTDVPLVSYMKTYFPDQKERVIQDSWAAAIAEHIFGAGKGCDNMACITIGTGIGCGVIINGKVFAGGMHTGGELGHTIVQKDGLLCKCGRKGCLERYSSGTGIFEQAYNKFPERFEGRDKNTHTVFDLAHEGYKPALELIDESMKYLGIGLANLVDILSVDHIFISGGLCQQKELVMEPLKKYVKKYGYFAWTRQDTLVVDVAEMGEDAPMLGAAFMYMDTVDNAS